MIPPYMVEGRNVGKFCKESSYGSGSNTRFAGN
jgi:hypothetical protein